ncbi:hypothetical protein CLV78_1011001 [Aliiruegeria haliotis]|uniref:Lipoprotein n=1 Tax=Aliiruegeria haliotis TaxID=1280846 RepID=A0A2T0S0E0_9RHOB|nr:argininosuccinate lyase [Aliiruegeria haliotis]PRY26897.1 hypothetical protein CLV78_1011001 [Aliiruegeria haliotis]
MIRGLLIPFGLLSLLAGCSADGERIPPNETIRASGITISGQAVMGVVGGSGSSAQFVSGLK